MAQSNPTALSSDSTRRLDEQPKHTDTPICKPKGLEDYVAPTVISSDIAKSSNKSQASTTSANTTNDAAYGLPSTSAIAINDAAYGLPSTSTSTQTETTLPSTARSITWVPVAEEIQPVHDVDIETMLEIDNQRDQDQLNKLGEILAEFERKENHGDVNDVDSLEVCNQTIGRVDKEEEEKKNRQIQLLQHIIMTIAIFKVEVKMMIIIFFFTIVCPTLTQDDEDEFPELTKFLEAESGPTDSNESWLVPETRKAAEFGIYTLGKDTRDDGDWSTPRSKPVNDITRVVNLKLKLRRGITLDSGSHHNVMPRRLVNKKLIRPSEGSKAGMFYTAANKGRIANEGEVDFKFQTMEGCDEEMCFQIAEVNKALAAIADRVDHNFRVVFDKNLTTGLDASYMLNKTTGRVIKTTRVGNVWIIEAIINAEDAGDESFVRRG